MYVRAGFARNAASSRLHKHDPANKSPGWSAAAEALGALARSCGALLTGLLRFFSSCLPF